MPAARRSLGGAGWRSLAAIEHPRRPHCRAVLAERQGGAHSGSSSSSTVVAAGLSPAAQPASERPPSGTRLPSSTGIEHICSTLVTADPTPAAPACGSVSRFCPSSLRVRQVGHHYDFELVGGSQPGLGRHGSGLQI